MLEALRSRLHARHPAGKHRLVLPLRTAPDLARHRTSGQGGFGWRGHFVPLAAYSGRITRAEIERLRQLAPVHRSWPL